MYDENEDKARLKGESKYYEVLSAAAASELPMHGALLISSRGTPYLYKSYTHGVPDVQDVFQYWVIELQKYESGEYGHIVHIAYDQELNMARRKGESKFYEVMSAAAVSTIPEHAAV